MKDFMFTLIAWLITLPLIVASVAFAIYNGQDVTLTVNPAGSPVDVPLYIPVLTAIGFGFLFGALMTWAAFGRLRHERRVQKKKIHDLEKRLTEIASNPDRLPAPRRYNYSLIPARLIGKKIP